MPEGRPRYRVEHAVGAPYTLTWWEAESHLADLRARDVEVVGDLEGGFEYDAPWPSFAGHVTVTPVTRGAAGNGSGAARTPPG